MYIFDDPYSVLFHKFSIQVEDSKNPNTLMMHYSARILPTKIIVIFSLIHTITAVWRQYINISTTIPAHTYGIYCMGGSQITCVIQWNALVNLDVYVYRQGSNLLGSSTPYKKIADQQPWTLILNCSSSGNYYLRVQPQKVYSSSVHYSISLRTPVLQQSTYSSTFYPQKQTNKRYQAFYFSPYKSTGLAVKYEIPGDTSTFSILCYGTSFASQYKITKETSICLPAQTGFYIFVIKDNLSSPTFLQPIQINTYYDLTVDCSNNQTTPNEPKATLLTSTSETSPTIGIIVGCVAAAVVIIIIVAYCRWRFKNNLVNVQAIQHTSNYYAYVTTKNLNLQQQINCAICLDLNCNAKLACGHFYHRKCIEEWMKRNSQCPLCRDAFRKSKIQTNQLN